MRLAMLLVLFVLAESTALAGDQIVNEQPTQAELDRYLVYREGDVTLKLDTRTGSSWVQCATKRQKLSWCRVKDRAPYPAGPVGRYRVIQSTQPLLMLDTVSGRTWVKCDDPTPEKSFSWCPVEE